MNLQNLSRRNIATMRTRSNFSSAHGLSDAQLRTMAPSAFATEAHDSRSARYAFIPTSDVIAGLRREGFVPTFAAQSLARDDSKLHHTKHLIRFRLGTEALTMTGLYPEVILVNGHDGSSSYQMFAGVFRPICMNGLMCGESYEAARIHHKGDAVREVIDASFTVVENSRRAISSSEEMSKIELNRDERIIFAEAAHQLRFDGAAAGEAIRPEQMLAIRRPGDAGNDIFTVLNRVQEATIRGGLRGWARDDQGRQTRRVTSRAVGGIDQNTALNRALWTLAERMQQLKAA